MTFVNTAWEHNLLSLAQSSGEGMPAFSPRTHNIPNTHLQQAYATCEAITARHSRSFHMASGLLPADKRRAVRALYAFCRVSDDIVDRGSGNIADQLAQWRQQALSGSPHTEDPVVLAWTDARLRHHIPLHYAHQLLDGVARDLVQTSYETFTDLTTYCYSVASTVGLMSMHITGYAGTHAIPYAIKLGVALQLTNILRDVAQDYQNGRIYLPREELAAYGLSAADLERGIVTPAWRDFMRFQIARNHQLYEEAWPGIALLDPSGRFAIAAAAELYRGILADIEAHDYDVFSRRAHVSGWGKLRRLPGIWWRSRETA
ncbi:MAG: phytoene/squalene synthase family protein [Anaerolineales bacterium]|nr:phytoene/squalene synthase family protein [Anaerolineales bacterium]MCB8952079.1 phytoene/squalene synthase family protein [Ardenticatenales bacterium]